MFQDAFKTYLVENLQKAKVVSGNSQVLTMCPFCGDSHKSSSPGHLYIGPFDTDESHPIWYNCKKCGTHGTCNSELLRMLGVHAVDMAVALSNYTKSTGFKTSKVKKNGSYKVNQNIAINGIDQISIEDKLLYISNRLEVDIGLGMCNKLKIVPNILDFLYANNITQYTRSYDIMKLINSDFVGFLSIDNSELILRNLNKQELPESINTRYVEYKLFDYTTRLYTIPSNVDLTSPEPIRIFIAEGVFDVLGLYFNTDNIKYNSVYCACLGKSDFLSAIRYFATNLGLVNTEFHICIDNDMEEYKLNYLIKLIDGLNANTFVHKNVFPNEKDFGVPKNRIQEQVRQVTCEN